MDKHDFTSDLNSLLVEVDSFAKKVINEGFRIGALKELKEHEKRTLGFSFIQDLNNSAPFERIRRMIFDLQTKKKA